MPIPTPDRVGAALAAGWRECVPAGWLAGWHPVRFELDGGDTEVVVAGEGPPVVLLPSLPGYKETWLRVVPRLARRHRVVCADLRVRFERAPRWDTLIADLERVTHAFAPGPAVVVGHSLGGALAQRWALAHPERVRALVLSSSFARVDRGPDTVLERWVEQPLVLVSQRMMPRRAALALARAAAARAAWVYTPDCGPEVLDLVRHGIAHLPLGAVHVMVRLALAHDTRHELARIAKPALVLVGGREAAWMRRAAAELGARIPAATVRPLGAIGHLHPLAAPERLVEALEEWLAALPA
ncbi:MAG TPA: alpha/beta hydrolase [Dongiaceae bacterium]|nr:alpha/beta hydrolase [Dongiaceae bacterium]